MQPRTRTSVTAAAALALVALLAPADALAQSERAAAEAIALTGSDSGSARSKANDWMIMPEGTTTFGGHLGFMTAYAGLGAEQIRFTDVVLATLHARRAFKDRYEVFGSASFLPKQPSFTDELVWQSASAGARVGAGERYAATLAFSGGTLMGDQGYWSAGGLVVQARKSLHPTLVVEGAMGGVSTVLFEETREQPSWLTEATASAELVFRVPNGMMAGWLGTEFRFPVAHDSSRSDDGIEPYAPQTRVNVNLGVVLSYIRDWDVYAKLAVVDRGDLVDPTTTLPILEGGFDQKYLIVGLTRRFRPDTHKRPDEAYYIAE